MSGGGNKTQSTTTSTTQLPEGTLGALNTSTNAAQSLFNSGSLFQPYTGSLMVEPDQMTTVSFDTLNRAAQRAQPGLNTAFDTASGIAGGTGLNSTQDDAISRMRAIAGNLQGYADGSMIGKGNPAFDAVLQRSQQDAQNAVNLGASAAGRYGSGVHQGNVAREVGDLTSRALSAQYNQDVQNMFAANTSLRGVSGDIFNAGQQGQSNRMAAANSLPALYQGTLAPGQTFGALGAINEDITARRLAEATRLHGEQTGQPRQSIEWLNAIAAGAGNLGATQTQTVQAPRTNPFMSAIGGATSGFGLGGGAGAAIGGGLGLLGGLLG